MNLIHCSPPLHSSTGARTQLGTRERKQREIAEREQLFMSQALDMIRSDGLLNLQMSRIAEKCEYAVGTLYLHFASKEDLLLALVTEVVRDHVVLMRKAADWKASSRDRMFAIGVADVLFVRKHPDFLRILQYSLCEVAWNAASPDRRRTFLEAQSPLLDVVTSIVRDAKLSGDLPEPGQRAEEIATGLWAMCTGYHSLAQAQGMLAGVAVEDPYRLMCQHILCLLDGYRWQPLSDSAFPDRTDRLIGRIRTEVFEDVCHAR